MAAAGVEFIYLLFKVKKSDLTNNVYKILVIAIQNFNVKFKL